MLEFVGYPKTLQQAVLYFSNPEKCHEFAVNMRWPKGVECPHCGCDRISFLKTRQKYKCKNSECRKQFSVKTQTVMEDSPLSLDKWLLAMWMVANCKNGISSYEIHRELGVTQKTAWFMLQRIRLAMQSDQDGKLSGEVEVDETLIGGKARFMHKSRKERTIQGTGTSGKTIVMGVLDRNARKVRAKVIENTDKDTLTDEVKEVVKKGSIVHTDGHGGYNELADEGFIHKVINHAIQYVNGTIHTNGIENFWSLLKRCIKGTYIGVETFHLFRYIDEQTFRYDYKDDDNLTRLCRLAGNVKNRRLTYKQLIGQLS